MGGLWFEIGLMINGFDNIIFKKGEFGLLLL